MVYPKYDYLSLMLFLYFLELIVSGTVKRLEVETASETDVSPKTVLCIFFLPALNLFVQFHWPCSENLEHSYYVFSHLQTAIQNLGWTPSQNCHHQNYIFFGGGPKLNLHLATDILGEEGKSNVMLPFKYIYM